MQKFGDRINWDNHVDEILAQKDRNIHHPRGDTEWGDAKDYIKTDTPKEKWKALDCGCHMGRWIDAVRKYGFEYTGVDQSEKALRVAKELRPDGEFIHTFLWDMGFKEEFDFAFTVAVLQHNLHAEQERIIPCIYNTLKYGGVFCMVEGTKLVGGDRTQRTQDDWIQTVEKYGFKLIKTFKKNPEGIEDRYIFIKEKK